MFVVYLECPVHAARLRLGLIMTKIKLLVPSVSHSVHLQKKQALASA